MRYTVTTLFIAVAFASLAGCGQTGPLYMPPEQVPEQVPETAPVTAPESVPQAQPAAPANSAAQPTKES